MDMMTRLAKAPKNTVIRGCRVAMIAAIKNVLSPGHVSLDHKPELDNIPISETTIMMNALNRAAEVSEFVESSVL